MSGDVWWSLTPPANQRKGYSFCRPIGSQMDFMSSIAKKTFAILGKKLKSWPASKGWKILKAGKNINILRLKILNDNNLLRRPDNFRAGLICWGKTSRSAWCAQSSRTLLTEPSTFSYYRHQEVLSQGGLYVLYSIKHLFYSTRQQFSPWEQHLVDFGRLHLNIEGCLNGIDASSNNLKASLYHANSPELFPLNCSIKSRDPWSPRNTRHPEDCCFLTSTCNKRNKSPLFLFSGIKQAPNRKNSWISETSPSNSSREDYLQSKRPASYKGFSFNWSTVNQTGICPRLLGRVRNAGNKNEAREGKLISRA